MMTLQRAGGCAALHTRTTRAISSLTCPAPPAFSFSGPREEDLRERTHLSKLSSLQQPYRNDHINLLCTVCDRPGCLMLFTGRTRRPKGEAYDRADLSTIDQVKTRSNQ
jgi:hypothetical protein